MKFLHCADLHLGCVGGQERMRAFERMLDFCKRESVSVLLIAGDLFEAVRADERTRRRVFDLLAGNPSLCTMIAAGNHDPLCAGGNYDGSLPGNVYVFGHDWSCAEIPAYGVRVWGASFAAASEKPFAPDRKKRKLTPGLYDLGVLHGDLVSPSGRSDYRAVTKQSIAQTGLKYLALGHIHERSTVRRAGDTLYAYSGCLQGLGYDEIGEKGAYLGEVDENGQLNMSFVKLCGSMTLEENVNLTGCADLAEAAGRCEKVLEGKQGHRVLLTLTGTTRGFSVDENGLLRLLTGCGAKIRIEDETRPETDAAGIAQENTLRGAFARRMLRRIAELEQNGQDAAAAREALQLGLNAFDGEVTRHAD